MKAVLTFSLLSSSIIYVSQAMGQSVFLKCQDIHCYSELEHGLSNSTHLANFCKDSITSGESRAKEYGLMHSQTKCGNLDNIEIVRPVCDCIIIQVALELEESVLHEDELENLIPPETSAMSNISDYWYPACHTQPCYSFLDITSDSAKQLYKFCETSLRESKLAIDELQDISEKELLEHCAMDPTGSFNLEDLKPACQCVTGLKTATNATATVRAALVDQTMEP
ncbi:hypothetical protein CDD81_4692 [Ophiocordyceps australis]|uniref:Uncharacterized protein n=1 Tax=Ophiocordyceps australis TaxID=1399860 RepID=A0A2C5Y4B3_9HYPO|nr:hypothetical protein CDD81_4692 [Ophiocordyceps australis]